MNERFTFSDAAVGGLAALLAAILLALPPLSGLVAVAASDPAAAGSEAATRPPDSPIEVLGTLVRPATSAGEAAP